MSRLLVPLLVAALCAWASAQTTTRVSVASSGAEADRPSFVPAISADGRFVAFESTATNLVLGDANDRSDVFVHDRETGVTERVSVGPGGVEASDHSYGPAISGDGRYVAFASTAPDLVTGDTNGVADVFLHDRLAGTTTRVSVGLGGAQANGPSGPAALSSDGLHVAFASLASNLVPLDSNGTSDVFVHDVPTGTTHIVSVATSGVQGTDHSGGDLDVSSDGRYVAFQSFAANLVAGDGNLAPDVFVRDRTAGVTTRVSVDSTGGEANNTSWLTAISDDGNRVAFQSYASNLVPGDTNAVGDVFVHDRTSGATTRASVSSSGGEGDGESGFHGLDISADGRVVVFDSLATNLVPDDDNLFADVFVHDLASGETERVNLDSAGGQADAGGTFDVFVYNTAISGDGRFVAFYSFATNLVSGDANGTADVFVRDRIALELVGVPASPNPVHLELSHATGETGNLFLALLSCSGTAGFGLPGGAGVVPLTFDPCTTLGLGFTGLLSGTIDAAGLGQTPAVVFPSLAPGIPIFAAAVTFDPAAGAFVSITGPISFTTQ